MYALAKGGFTQSYTYFAWRHSKWEFTEYLRELTRPPVSDFYRPNFWPNTPDILPGDLQFGGRHAFVQRLILAATLSSNYGIYGPPFELMEHVARPGSEEYVDNEKYQLRAWDIDRADSLRDVIAPCESHPPGEPGAAGQSHHVSPDRQRAAPRLQQAER